MSRVAAVVLAAGGSSRLGQPKQLLMFRGETLLRRAVRAAADAGCAPILVVVGEINEEEGGEEEQEQEQELMGPALVVNSEWRRGMGTSIRRGVEKLPEAVGAVVLLTCDQPFLEAAIVSGLIAAQKKTGKPIVASSYANTIGVPALFDRSCFDALLALPDATGAKAFILSRHADVAAIPFEEGAIDIDTPEDLERLTSL